MPGKIAAGFLALALLAGPASAQHSDIHSTPSSPAISQSSSNSNRHPPVENPAVARCYWLEYKRAIHAGLNGENAHLAACGFCPGHC